MKIDLEFIRSALKHKEYPFQFVSEEKGKIKVKEIMKRYPSGYMALLEDMAFLCLNDDFIKSIKDFRQELRSKIRCEKLPFRVKISEAKKEANKIIKKRKILKCLVDRYTRVFMNSFIIQKTNNKVRLAISKIDKNCKIWYRDNLIELCRRHNLLIGLFAKDYIDDNLITIKEKTPPRLSILESVIFINDPLAFCPSYNKPYTIYNLEPMRFKHYRGGNLKISVNKDTKDSYIEGTFPIFSTKKDILEVIEYYFPQINSKIRQEFKIRNKRDHRKDTLYKDIFVYSLYKKGDTLEEIALEIDKIEGSRSGEAEGYTQGSIQVTINRMKKGISRFDAKPD